MSGPFWVQELAERFWSQAGGPLLIFPRDLRLPIARAFPLSPVGLNGLRVAQIDEWLEDAAVRCSLDVADRPLRACLVAYGGAGAVFLDTEDPDDEQRFSLAHELAHFLHDYAEPRRRAAEKLGPDALEILDGTRRASRADELRALLAGVPLSFYVHLMERSPDGAMSERVAGAESDADRLALELLAPREAVEGALARGHGAGSTLQRPVFDEVVEIVRTRFGLPADIAARYAETFVPRQTASPLTSWLRIVK